ncbi:carboxypeptidase-like regulatory domain-containing protein [Gilvibacter sp.]|uniref:carboxypeptidase-like regulatory domain-containing protein n=1 Tax=Gilvibacter sp. TaxID=2729997 RepID=UPI0025BADBED|nr:carboxypeptidase-like regulatory domain-containing protein [Gilvibacter sp.]NQX77135.1 carboxypeptidase-like regulatory domain-containing protein [Gilvibacter sp.]
MRAQPQTPKRNFRGLMLLLLATFLFSATTLNAQDAAAEYTEFRGKILDKEGKDPVVFATLLVTGTNISTVSNTEGDYLLKVPNEYLNASLEVSLLGFETYTVPLSEVPKSKHKIYLTVEISQLSEISVTRFADANALVRAVFRKRGDNTLPQPARMTAFYRETIKRRNRNVSLTEAVVDLYKQPSTNNIKDVVALDKARKSTDYRRLDTVALKLQGGPFSTLYLDIMKYPEYIFTEDTYDLYDFSLESSTAVNDRPVYVVSFKQKDFVLDPLYYGQLYIDTETLALTSAEYQLLLTDKKAASALFVKRKPGDIVVTPTRAAYRVDYREKDGRWFYGYGSVDLTFKINKKRKLFNSVYSLNSEMAVTNWELITNDQIVRPKDRLRPSVVITDEISGFSDPDFWGARNVIEPEKSIESAINKIQRQMRRSNK